MKGFLFAVSLVLLAGGAHAQESDSDFRTRRNTVTISASLFAYGSDPAYGTECSYARFFCPYVGVSGGLSFQHWLDDVTPSTDASSRSGISYHLKDDDSKLELIQLVVGPVLRTPDISFGRSERLHLFYQCEPGLLVNFLANESFIYARTYEDGRHLLEETQRARNRGGQTTAWRVRSSVMLGTGLGLFAIGYTLSNQDPYTGRRHVFFDDMQLKSDMPSRRFTHEFFVSATYSF
ncbi:hypothetical protein [Hallella seregens]|uniref:Outer membrane protein beta-barrel domain-containing protein n=1 Tax=Hallella seregens ATCC 51272 TaxID=1336250 RepID=A0ABV5ZG18_9BACT|nr:hypothetical protein [Hallella seregens]